MINLIPPNAQKQVKREYWVRVAGVWGILVATAFTIVALLYVPAYVLVKSKLSAYESIYQLANVRNESFVESEKEVTEAMTIARLLVGKNDSVSYTELIQIFNNLAGKNVSITNLHVAQTDGIFSSISISGVAQSRTSLVAFRDALEAHKLFESAELPLSNLAKEYDIPFSINVIPSILKK